MVEKEKNIKVAIICAREGSSRIKNKNLKILNNKPLIFYTVEAAINSKIFDKIYINSDSKKILKQVKKHYSHNKLFFYLRRFWSWKYICDRCYKRNDIIIKN